MENQQTQNNNKMIMKPHAELKQQPLKMNI